MRVSDSDDSDDSDSDNPPSRPSRATVARLEGGADQRALPGHHGALLRRRLAGADGTDQLPQLDGHGAWADKGKRGMRMGLVWWV